MSELGRHALGRLRADTSNSPGCAGFPDGRRFERPQAISDGICFMPNGKFRGSLAKNLRSVASSFFPAAGQLL
jgi:hypothetical protein